MDTIEMQENNFFNHFSLRVPTLDFYISKIFTIPTLLIRIVVACEVKNIEMCYQHFKVFLLRVR